MKHITANKIKCSEKFYSNFLCFWSFLVMNKANNITIFQLEDSCELSVNLYQGIWDPTFFDKLMFETSWGTSFIYLIIGKKSKIDHKYGSWRLPPERNSTGKFLTKQKKVNPEKKKSPRKPPPRKILPLKVPLGKIPTTDIFPWKKLPPEYPSPLWKSYLLFTLLTMILNVKKHFPVFFVAYILSGHQSERVKLEKV